MELKQLTPQEELELAKDVIDFLEKKASEGLLIRKAVIELVKTALEAETQGQFIYPKDQENQ